jgi:hypothetical protein
MDIEASAGAINVFSGPQMFLGRCLQRRGKLPVIDDDGYHPPEIDRPAKKGLGVTESSRDPFAFLNFNVCARRYAQKKGLL